MKKHDEHFDPLTVERCHEELLDRRHEPGFRYCVEAVDHALSDAHRAERLALVEYCARLYGNATIPPPPRRLLFCDNTRQGRKVFQEIAEELNEVARNFEARLRGVANPGKPSDADGEITDGDERKEAAR